MKDQIERFLIHLHQYFVDELLETVNFFQFEPKQKSKQHFPNCTSNHLSDIPFLLRYYHYFDIR